MTTVITGNERSKKYVFKREHNTGSDGADVICCGRLFQIRTAATYYFGDKKLFYQGRGPSPSINPTPRRLRRLAPSLLKSWIRHRILPRSQIPSFWPLIVVSHQGNALQNNTEWRLSSKRCFSDITGVRQRRQPFSSRLRVPNRLTPEIIGRFQCAPRRKTLALDTRRLFGHPPSFPTAYQCLPSALYL